MKHVREVPPPMRTRVPDVPAQLESIVNAAHTKDIEMRYKSADEMRIDLVDYERGRPLTFAYEPGATPAPGATAPPTVAAAVAQQVIPPQHHRRRNWAGVFAAIIALGLLGAVVAYVLINTSESKKDTPQVDVPDVIGQQFDAASQLITQNGLTVSRLNDDVSTDIPGKVVKQDPAGGRKADKGSAVVLTVVSGESVVPNLVTQQYDAAVPQLQRIGLVPARRNVDSDQVPPGTVLASDPPATTRVPKGSTVTLEVAQTPGVDIPDVRGKSEEDALNTLRYVGLQPTSTPQPNDTVPKDQAIGTDPATGTRVPRGSTVRVFISSGPNEFDVPNTIGQTQGAAVNALTSAGFNVIVNFTNSGPASRGLDVNQSPTGGKLPKGGTVTITVGQ
jgi:serine/threonine-protein kinase